MRRLCACAWSLYSVRARVYVMHVRRHASVLPFHELPTLPPPRPSPAHDHRGRTHEMLMPQHILEPRIHQRDTVAHAPVLASHVPLSERYAMDNGTHATRPPVYAELHPQYHRQPPRHGRAAGRHVVGAVRHAVRQLSHSLPPPVHHLRNGAHVARASPYALRALRTRGIAA